MEEKKTARVGEEDRRAKGSVQINHLNVNDVL